MYVRGSVGGMIMFSAEIVTGIMDSVQISGASRATSANAEVIAVEAKLAMVRISFRMENILLIEVSTTVGEVCLRVED